MIVQGDALRLPLAAESVDLIVTSPPYFALRSYRDDGEHYDGQIGSEPTPEAFLDALDRCMVEMGRVLKASGSVWINLGDKYSNRIVYRDSSHQSGLFPDREDSTLGKTWVENKAQGRTRMATDNIIGDGFIREKSLMGLPWRFAIRQIDAGWILRAEVIWSKPNGLPESVTDRVRRSHEQWFHFVKEPRYFSAVDEIREPHTTADRDVVRESYPPGMTSGKALDGTFVGRRDLPLNALGRLPGSVWTIPTEPLKVPEQFVDHFAAFPQEWPRKIISAWCPEGGVVLDPFGGTGTVAGVARKLGRTGISLDLSLDYSRLAKWRVYESGHFDKTLKRTMHDKQGTLI